MDKTRILDPLPPSKELQSLQLSNKRTLQFSFHLSKSTPKRNRNMALGRYLLLALVLPRLLVGAPSGSIWRGNGDVDGCALDQDGCTDGTVTGAGKLGSGCQSQTHGGCSYGTSKSSLGDDKGCWGAVY